MKPFLRTYILSFALIAAAILAGCTGKGAPKTKHIQRLSDTLYTFQKAMNVYDYQPKRALQIVDSAEARGNISSLKAEYTRARIYAWTVMGAQVDSLLRGQAGVRFDSARVISERLLENDSVKNDLAIRQNVLEVLIYSARQLKDSLLFLRSSQELVEVCREQGAETEALRTEAEVGAALYKLGHRAEGMARIDSVIVQLDSRDTIRFNELDASIIALKRKIALFIDEGKYIDAIPLARRVIEKLSEYELAPAKYHDGTYREPTDSTSRADYIAFYRTQAQSTITAAYAMLGETGNLNEAYAMLEGSVRDATAREHIARYHALEKQMQMEKAESRHRLLAFIANALVLGLVVLIVFAAYVYFQNRRIKRKNRALVRQINEAIDHQRTEKNAARKTNQPAEEASGEELFAEMDALIRAERLYSNAAIQRQDICERFGMRREVLNQLLNEFADGQSFPIYINSIRLSEACLLLRHHPEQTVNAIAEQVGLSPRNFRRIFVERYGITPSEYRDEL